MLFRSLVSRHDSELASAIKISGNLNVSTVPNLNDERAESVVFVLGVAHFFSVRFALSPTFPFL